MRVLLLGLGNAICGDDGVGPAVLERLRRRGLPRGLRVEDGGCDSLRLASLWDGERQVWLVDAMRGGGAPGSVHRLGHEEILALPQAHQSAHRLSLPENLRWLALAFAELSGVRYRLWGVEPLRLEAGAPLSPPVARAADEVAAEIHHQAHLLLARRRRRPLPETAPCA